MAHGACIKRRCFENVIERDVYTLDSITNPVVLGCGNVRERMEKIWKEPVDKQHDIPKNGDNESINMAGICVFDCNKSTEEKIIRRIRQGGGVPCPKRCQGVDVVAKEVYCRDLLQELYVQNKYSQVDFVISAGKIECVARYAGVELMEGILATVLKNLLLQTIQASINYASVENRCFTDSNRV